MIDTTSPHKAKTSIYIPQMNELLGLFNVEGYWLIKKNYFKTIIATGQICSMLDSFDE